MKFGVRKNQIEKELLIDTDKTLWKNLLYEEYMNDIKKIASFIYHKELEENTYLFKFEFNEFMRKFNLYRNEFDSEVYPILQGEVFFAKIEKDLTLKADEIELFAGIEWKGSNYYIVSEWLDPWIYTVFDAFNIFISSLLGLDRNYCAIKEIKKYLDFTEKLS